MVTLWDIVSDNSFEFGQTITKIKSNLIKSYEIVVGKSPEDEVSAVFQNFARRKNFSFSVYVGGLGDVRIH